MGPLIVHRYRCSMKRNSKASKYPSVRLALVCLISFVALSACVTTQTDGRSSTQSGKCANPQDNSAQTNSSRYGCAGSVPGGLVPAPVH